jgi:hypothetical protein
MSRGQKTATALVHTLLRASAQAGTKAPLRGHLLLGDHDMLRVAKTSILVLAALGFALAGHGQAMAGCQVISATHSADSKGDALKMSQALAAQSANELRASKGWHSITMTAYRVKPDPFWKMVRPVVPKDVIIGSYVTPRTYTTCFTGVVVPYVCTSGSKVCGN